MTTKRLHESVASLPATSEGNGIFDVTVISPGWGSSGFYSESMIREFGPKVFKKNRAMFANHATEDEMATGRDMTKIWAKIHEDARWEDGRLKAKIKVPNAEKREFVEEFMDTIGLSIFVEGNAVEGEAEGRKGLIIESLNADDAYASLDFVVAAGRGGRVEQKLLESFKAVEDAAEKRTEDISGGKEGNSMNLEEKLEKLIALFEASISESKDAAAKLAKEQADAATAAEDVNAKVKATIEALNSVHEAKLPAPLEAELVSAVESGNTDVKPLIERAKNIEKAIAESLGVSDDVENVRVNESKSKTEKVSSLSIFGGGE